MKKNFTLAIAILVIAYASQAQDTWTQKADFAGGGRYGAVGFSIGDKGYIGTGFVGIGSSDRNDLWEYDSNTDTWAQKADMGGQARTCAVGFSIGNKGYIGTGYYQGNRLRDFWEYDPVTNTWTERAKFPGTKRWRAVGFSIGNKGYIGTGNDGDRTKDFWEYDPSTNSWTQKADFGGTAREQSVGFSIGDKGYIATGNDGNFKDDLWEYNPTNDTWIQKANFSGAARKRAVGFSIGNKGYLGTGESAGFASRKDFWEYDPSTDSWSQKTDVGGQGRSMAVGFSINDRGYIGVGFHDFKDDFWEYAAINCSVPNATITPLGNLDICSTGFVKLQSSGGIGYTYQWLRNNTAISGATNQVYKATQIGKYKVNVSSGLECDSLSEKVVVSSSCKFSEETEFTFSLNVFPNPTTRTFTLDLKLDDEENSQATIQVLNMLGQVVYDQTTSVSNGALQKEIQLSDGQRMECIW